MLEPKFSLLQEPQYHYVIASKTLFHKINLQNYALRRLWAIIVIFLPKKNSFLIQFSLATWQSQD